MIKGKTYKIKHPDKGVCICRITHIDKRAKYGTILECSKWLEEKPGDDIRILKSKIIGEIK